MELELKALNVLDSISDLPLLDEKKGVIFWRPRNLKRRFTSVRKLKNPALLSPCSSVVDHKSQLLGLGSRSKKSSIRIPKIVPASLSPWTEEQTESGPLHLFAEKSKKEILTRSTSKKQLNLQEYIMENPIAGRKSRTNICLSAQNSRDKNNATRILLSDINLNNRLT